jgi:hypothetical protein
MDMSDAKENSGMCGTLQPGLLLLSLRFGALHARESLTRKLSNSSQRRIQPTSSISFFLRS